MLFNAEKCKKLSKEYLDNATPKELHEFDWVDDDKIGEIPVEYNHLVGYYPKHDNIKAIHYTNGGPWFDEYKNSEMAQLWWNVYGNL